MKKIRNNNKSQINLIRLGLNIFNIFFVFVFVTIAAFSSLNLNVQAQVRGNTAMGTALDPICFKSASTDFYECQFVETFNDGGDSVASNACRPFEMFLRIWTPTGWNKLGSGADGDCDKFLQDRTYTAKVSAIIDKKEGGLVGLKNCSLKKGNSDVDAYTSIAGKSVNNCNGMFLEGVQSGEILDFDTSTGQLRKGYKIVTATLDKSLFDTCRTGKEIDEYIIRGCGTNTYVLNKRTGNYAISGDLRSLSKIQYDAIKTKKDIEGYFTKDQLDRMNKELGAVEITALKGELGVETFAKERYKKNANNIAKAVGDLMGGKCEAYIDKEVGVALKCTKKIDGKDENVDLSGKKLDEKCSAFGITLKAVEVGPTIGNTGLDFAMDPKYKCIAKEQFEKIKASTDNVDSSKISTAVDTGKIEGGAGVDNLIVILFNIIAAILLIILYFVGWAASGVLAGLGALFLFILSMNPADPIYINAAARPWQVLIGLANLVTLSTFIIVGLGYILNLQSFKIKLSQFILNVAIFSLLLQFTLQGVGLFVNVSNGLGDVMVAAYAGLDKGGKPNKEKLISGLISGMNSVSLIRCGNWEGETLTGVKNNAECKSSNSVDPSKAEDKKDDAGAIVENLKSSVGSVGGAFGGKVSTKPIQAFIMETVFILTVIFAIILMFRGVTQVLFRVVGLWLLMVVSPLALAVYFSPIKSLKKYGSDWLDKFWRLCLAYPAFILGLVLIGKLAEGFGVALSQSTNQLGTSGPIQELFNVFLFAMVTALVTIGSFALLIQFMEAVFGAMAKALLGGIKSAIGSVGKALKFGGKVFNAGATTSAFAGKVLKGGFTGIGGSLGKSAAKLPANSVRAKILNKLAAGSSMAGIAAGKVFNAPDFIGSVAKTPGKIFKGFKKDRELQIGKMDQNVDDNIEILARKMGVYNALNMGKSGSYETFNDGIEGLSDFDLADKRAGSLARKEASIIGKKSYTSDGLARESTEWANDPSKFNPNDPEQMIKLAAMLKNPVAAQNLLASKEFRDIIGKNRLKFNPEDFDELLKEYPLPDFFANKEADAKNYITSLSADDAKKINVSTLQANSPEAYAIFAKRFPKLAVDSQSDYNTSAGSSAEIAFQPQLEGILKDGNIGVARNGTRAEYSRANAERDTYKNMVSASTNGVPRLTFQQLSSETAGMDLGQIQDKIKNELIKSNYDDNVNGYELTAEGATNYLNGVLESKGNNVAEALQEFEGTDVGRALSRQVAYQNLDSDDKKMTAMRAAVTANVVKSAAGIEPISAQLHMVSSKIATGVENAELAAAPHKTARNKMGQAILEGIDDLGLGNFNTDNIEEIKSKLRSGDAGLRALGGIIGASTAVNDAWKNEREISLSDKSIVDVVAEAGSIGKDAADILTMKAELSRITQMQAELLGLGGGSSSRTATITSNAAQVSALDTEIEKMKDLIQASQSGGGQDDEKIAALNSIAPGADMGTVQKILETRISEALSRQTKLNEQTTTAQAELDAGIGDTTGRSGELQLAIDKAKQTLKDEYAKSEKLGKVIDEYAGGAQIIEQAITEGLGDLSNAANSADPTSAFIAIKDRAHQQIGKAKTAVINESAPAYTSAETFTAAVSGANPKQVAENKKN